MPSGSARTRRAISSRCRPQEAGLVLAKMKGAGVPCARIGTTGGEAIAIAGELPVAVADLKTGFEGWFPAYMNGAN